LFIWLLREGQKEKAKKKKRKKSHGNLEDLELA
jgi:hypothetical protein